VSTRTADRFETARAVADAVLYEGYVLYPYRASSRKNQARFQWGVLTPRSFSHGEGSERWSMRTECLLDPGAAPTISVRIRCLQAQHRRVETTTEVGSGSGEATVFAPTAFLEVEGVRHADWDEAVDRVVDVTPLGLRALEGSGHVEEFSFPGGADSELVRAADGTVTGRFVRQREPVSGRVRIVVGRPIPSQPYLKVAVAVENATAVTALGPHRDDALGHSLIAVHTMLAVDDGRFVSLLDPPDGAARAAASCHSDGTHPVLIGEDDVVLSSPIILYDHPEVAAQSPGDLYDSLEIDEILALRVMTLTDEEKSEARGTDPRAAAIIDRCDHMSAETLGMLHGQMRPVEQPSGSASFDDPSAVPWWDPEADAAFDPWTETVRIGGAAITKGSNVRLRPSHRADAQDIFLAGLTATVAGVFTDVDGDQHVAVTIDDDPATEELAWQGRYLFFHPDEVEPPAEGGQDP
jgi:hypothetical protein